MCMYSTCTVVHVYASIHVNVHILNIHVIVCVHVHGYTLLHGIQQDNTLDKHTPLTIITGQMTFSRLCGIIPLCLGLLILEIY